MAVLASHPSPNFGPDAPVPAGIDLGDGASVQIPRGGGPGNEDPELSCICCLVPVEQDPEPTDPDGGGRGGEGRSLTCCSDGVCDDGDPCTVNDACGGPHGWGCVDGSCCGERLRCPKGKCDDRAYCAGGVCVQEPEDCDDGSACTTDWCDGDTGCEHRWCASRDCFIAHCVDDHCEYEERICPDDGNECTDDYCAGDICHHNRSGPCTDDGNVCTDDLCIVGSNGVAACEHPQNNNGAECWYDENVCSRWICVNDGCNPIPDHQDEECDDEEPPNECTDDVCDQGSCTHPAVPDGTGCESDEDPCTDDICQGGACTHPAKDDLTPCTDDDEFCTADYCQGGSCIHPAIHENEPCTDDGLECTDDVCQGGTCAHPAMGDGTACSDEIPPDPCTDDICQGTTCDHPRKCPESDGPCVKECCVGGNCLTDNKAQPCEFTIELEDGAGCRGSTVVLEATLRNNGTCARTFSLTTQQTGGAVSFDSLTTSGAVLISPQAEQVVSVTATIAADSPPGEAFVQLTASNQSDGTCDPQVTLTDITVSRVTVIEVDLDMDGLLDAKEELPGGYLCLNDDDDNNNGIPDKDEGTPIAAEDDLRMMALSISNATEGKVTLSVNSGRIAVYEASDRTDPVALPSCWATPPVAGCGALSDMPAVLWSEGADISVSARDSTLSLSYESGSSSCTDDVVMTVVRVEFESPIDTDGNGVIDDPGNEFVYDAAEPAQLVVPINVRIFPDTDPIVRTDLEGRVRTHVGPIDDSHGAMTTVGLTWNTPLASDPTVGRAVYSPGTGGTWNAIATFSGMPSSNADFGGKTGAVEILRDDGGLLCRREAEYEVFFKPLPRNNPGPEPDDIPTTIDLNQVEAKRRSHRR